MGALPDVANVIRVRVLFTVDEKTEQGVRFFIGYTGTPPTVADLTTIGAFLKTAADADLPDLMFETNYLTGYILEDLSSNVGAVATIADNTQGGLTGLPVPAGAAMVSSYEISKRYRGGHPRSYWPLGYASSLASADLWDSTFVAGCQSAIPAVVESMNGESAGSVTITNQVAVNYYSGFTAVENPLTHRYRNVPTLLATPNVYDVESIVARDYVGSMRKRRPKTS